LNDKNNIKYKILQFEINNNMMLYEYNPDYVDWDRLELTNSPRARFNHVIKVLFSDIPLKGCRLYYRHQFNMVVTDLKYAHQLGQPVADCRFEYPTTVIVDGNMRTYKYDVGVLPTHVQLHGWRFIYKLLNPKVYADPKTVYPLQVRYDYFIAHLENAKSELALKKAMSGARVRITETLQYINHMGDHESLYGHQLNYLKWLQDDVSNSIDMTFSNMDDHREYISLPETYEPKRNKAGYVTHLRFRFQFDLSLSLFHSWNDAVVIPPQLAMLKAKLSADYFECLRHFAKDELTRIKRIQLPHSGMLIRIPIRVSMLVAQFL
jgi:hypothetical protein